MKKILLLIVSGLLIACMAGSAMAATAKLVKTDGSDLTAEDFVLTPGVPRDVKFFLSEIQSTDINKDYVLSSSVRAETAGCYDTDITVSFINPNFNLLNTNDYTHPGIISITSNSEVPNAVYQVNIYAKEVVISGGAGGTINTQYYDFVMTSNDFTSVPEFPTLALPIASILGLIFIFGRKKEGL